MLACGALLDTLTRIDLQVVVVAMPDETRQAARATATEAAIARRRGELLYEATSAVREAVLRIFARSGFSGTWAVTDMAVSVTRAGDRVAAAAAFEEAAMAAVVEDLVDEETTDILRSTTAGLFGMTGMPAPGSLSSFATPAAGSVQGTDRGRRPDRVRGRLHRDRGGLQPGNRAARAGAGMAVAAGLTRQRRSVES